MEEGGGDGRHRQMPWREGACEWEGGRPRFLEGETSRASEGWDTGEAGGDRPCKTKEHPRAVEDSRQWMV